MERPKFTKMERQGQPRPVVRKKPAMTGGAYPTIDEVGEAKPHTIIEWNQTLHSPQFMRKLGSKREDLREVKVAICDRYARIWGIKSTRVGT